MGIESDNDINASAQSFFDKSPLFFDNFVEYFSLIKRKIVKVVVGYKLQFVLWHSHFLSCLHKYIPHTE